LALAPEVRAQEITLLAPMAEEYQLGGFRYLPPPGDGWRQVGTSSDAFRIVYAEQLDEQRINTRLEVVAQTFEIPDPDMVSDALTLTRISQAQQVKERGDTLVAFSGIEKVGESPPVYLFTLVTKVMDSDVFETFAVSLAPDKSAYLVVKLSTREKEFKEAPYYQPFLASLDTLEFPSAASDGDEPSEEAESSPSSED
jgi:hypothetical protein